ncbi:UNVERIFIED_CONTAM: hypothetical protein GTU68_054472 [Idotea baltica]|nr:hypothetical protein [Idotea baltica]
MLHHFWFEQNPRRKLT